jgi:hypothetical protein
MPAFMVGHAEVHQQPKAQVHDLEAGEQLAHKHRVQRPSGFDFDNDGPVVQVPASDVSGRRLRRRLR